MDLKEMLRMTRLGGVITLADGSVITVPALEGLGEIECAQAAVTFLSQCDHALGGDESLRTLIKAFEAWLRGEQSGEEVDLLSKAIFDQIVDEVAGN